MCRIMYIIVSWTKTSLTLIDQLNNFPPPSVESGRILSYCMKQGVKNTASMPWEPNGNWVGQSVTGVCGSSARASILEKHWKNSPKKPGTNFQDLNQSIDKPRKRKEISVQIHHEGAGTGDPGNNDPSDTLPRGNNMMEVKKKLKCSSTLISICRREKTKLNGKPDANIREKK